MLLPCVLLSGSSVSTAGLTAQSGIECWWKKAFKVTQQYLGPVLGLLFILFLYFFLLGLC